MENLVNLVVIPAARVRLLKVKDSAKVSEDILEEQELEDLEEDATIVEVRIWRETAQIGSR